METGLHSAGLLGALAALAALLAALGLVVVYLKVWRPRRVPTRAREELGGLGDPARPRHGQAAAASPSTTASREDEPHPDCRDFLRPTAESLGGRIKRRDIEVVCLGEIEHRPFEVSVATASGGVTAKVELRRPVSGVQLYYDPDEDNDDRVKLGDHLFLDESDDEDVDPRAVLDALPAGALEEILRFMQDTGVFRLGVDDAQLEIELLQVASELDSADIPACVHRLAVFAAAFETTQ
jgi:hypothetical protein